MQLRKLQKEDAELMLEWMHDSSVVEFMGANFAEKTIEDCRGFIDHANETKDDLHLAIVDENDEYMGTVSLKNISLEEENAEFAITVRKKAMGNGYSTYGMKKILEKGIKELGLKEIYWCVSKVNNRAVKFYDKNLYERVIEVPANIKDSYSEEQNKQFIWYRYR